MKRSSRIVLRRLKRDEGTNLVEAALLLPLLLFLTFAIIEFAAVFFVYLSLEYGVSEATRYGVTGAQMPNLSREDSMRAVLRQATPVITLADNEITFSHLQRGGSAWLAGAGGPNEIVKIQVDHTWNIITPLLRPMFTNGRIPLRVNSAMKNEP